jgi:hypothetical protein
LEQVDGRPRRRLHPRPHPPRARAAMSIRATRVRQSQRCISEDVFGRRCVGSANHLGMHFHRGRQWSGGELIVAPPLVWVCPCGEDCEVVDYPTGVRSCGNVEP